MGEIRLRAVGVARRVALAGSAVALLCVLSPLAPAAAGAVKADFGDAPDGAPARYVTAPGVIGHFPSKAGTPGPRHNPFGSFFLGAGVNGEADSAQVDKDRFDDGASVSLAKCGSSTLDVVLNGAALPPATLTSAHVAYVNAWFDWNRDGDWADSSDSCSPEWAVQNLPVSMDKLSPGGVAVLPVGFTAGGQTQDIWERVTLTLDQPISSSNGGGSASPYTQGETEDYLIPTGEEKPVIVPPLRQKKRRRARRRRARRRGRRSPPKKPGKFKVSCAPDPAVIPHGGVATVKFVIVDTGKGWIFGSPSTQKGPAGKASVTPVKPQPKGVPPGFVAADGFKQSGSKVDPPLRVQTVVVKFTFTRGRQTQNLSCKVLIVHWAAGNLFLPRVVCEGACRGVPPPPKPIGTLHGGGTLQSPFLTQSFFDVFFDLDVDAFKVVLPAGNQVMNPQVPPGAPYSCAPVTKTTENDTLLCTGNLPANTHAQGNFHTSAPISPNSAQLYGRQPGSATFEGPFTLSGP
jgi:hypothetical protein